MISKYAVRKYMEEHNSEYKLVGEDIFTTDNSGKDVFICTLDKLVEIMRKNNHCNFEVVYSCHGTLDLVLRCKDCGAIIFTGDDIDRYDPNLCCPNCGGYKGPEYWTKEEIEADEKKQNTLKFYEDWTKYEKERDEREKRRGLSDRELLKKEFRGKNKYTCITLERMGIYGKDFPLKGLNLYIRKGKKDEDGFGYIISKSKRIPLSPYAFYIVYIVPRTKQYRKLHNELENIRSSCR